MSRDRVDRQKRAAQASRPPAFEALERRELLSGGFNGPTAIRPVRANSAIYTFTMTGGGVETARPVGKGAYALTLYNTNASSVLSVAQTFQHPRSLGLPLSIASIRVVTGQIGTIQAGGATLLGPVSPLNGVNTLQFGSLGPNARVDVRGSAANLNFGGVDLGANGLVHVAGDVTGGFNAGGLNLNGGRVLIDGDLSGAFHAGSVSIRQGGVFAVGRDTTGGFNITGGMNLADNGRVAFGRNLSNVHVGSDLVVASGGGINVGGNLNGFVVDGTFQGQGNKAVPDLAVGLDLNNLQVTGGSPNSGGLMGATVQVGKNLVGLNVPHGIFDSFITAGVLIDGGGAGGAGGNIGPDGPDSVLNSQIIAGVKINNITINGNVRSTFATDQASKGYPTRIIAGMDRSGTIAPGGVIDNFQILGTLYDSVLAASVLPYGDSGLNPTTGTYAFQPPPNGQPGDLGHNTYDAPAGTTAVGTVGTYRAYPNYTFNSYYNEQSLASGNQTFHNTAIDPIIDDYVLPGAINPSFASLPLSQAALSTAVTIQTTSGGTTSTQTTSPTVQPLPIPTKSTVLGGVVTTAHGQEADFAGINAADTRGVFVGEIPTA